MNISNRMWEALESLMAHFGAGRVFYVIPSARAWKEQFVIDKGVSVHNVFTSLGDALGQCSANRGDIIMVEPGTYTLTAAQAVSVAGVTIMGRKGFARQTIIAGLASAGVNALNITAADVKLCHLTIQGGSATSFAVSCRSTTTVIEDCYFDSKLDGGADGIEFQNGADECQVSDCVFEETFNSLLLLSTAAGGPDRLTVERCLFRNVVVMITDAGSAASVANRLVVNNCVSQGTLVGGYIKLNTVLNTGIVTNCSFALATNAAAQFVIPAGVFWTANATEAGVSTARPA